MLIPGTRLSPISSSSLAGCSWAGRGWCGIQRPENSCTENCAGWALLTKWGRNGHKMWGDQRYSETKWNKLILHSEDSITNNFSRYWSSSVSAARKCCWNQETTPDGQFDEPGMAIAPYNLESTRSNGSSICEYGSCSSPSDWVTRPIKKPIQSQFEHGGSSWMNSGWLLRKDGITKLNQRRRRNDCFYLYACIKYSCSSFEIKVRSGSIFQFKDYFFLGAKAPLGIGRVCEWVSE